MRTPHMAAIPFISGHSADGWLAAMVGMDNRWLKAEGVSNRDLAGIIPVSTQVTTRSLVKKLLGDTEPEFRPLIDEWAPLYHASKDSAVLGAGHTLLFDYSEPHTASIARRRDPIPNSIWVELTLSGGMKTRTSPIGRVRSPWSLATTHTLAPICSSQS